MKAQVRNLAWQNQPDDGDLAAGASVTVEVDVYDADVAGRRTVGPVGLVADAATGGVRTTLAPGEGDRREPLTLKPGEGQSVAATFALPDDDSLRGPARLVVVVPVEGLPALEIPIADPGRGGPRWVSDQPVLGQYLYGGVSQPIGPHDLVAIDPLGAALRASWGRFVVGIEASFTLLYQEALAGGPPGYGVSGLAQVTWQPWRWSIAPYVEGGGFLGRQKPPAAYPAPAQTIDVPRVGGGLLFTWGPRLGPASPLPFDRPLSPQRRSGGRLGYTRGFDLDVGTSGGAGGVGLWFERGTDL